MSLWPPRPGANLEQVKDFQYLGSWVDESEKDFKVRKALAWKACNKMRTLWKSSLHASLKISFFLAAVESILLYGAEGWTITHKLEARLDGCYTRLLMMVLDLNWKDHSTREEIYGNLPKVSEVVSERRLNQFLNQSSGSPHKALVPKGDQGWHIPSSLVKALAWNLKNYSNLCKTEHCGENSSWLPTKVDEIKVVKYTILFKTDSIWGHNIRQGPFFLDTQ